MEEEKEKKERRIGLFWAKNILVRREFGKLQSRAWVGRADYLID
jgi:hypothetical protein